MSLNWDLTKIENYKELCWLEPQEDMGIFPSLLNGEGKFLNPITDSLIWGTMAVSIGKIAEDNATGFLARLIWADRLDGRGTKVQHWEDGKWKTRDLKLQDIRDHIGLTTNVAFEPTSSWTKRIGIMYFDKLERDVGNTD